ncbi:MULTISPECIES: hypothetical protein [Cupriavidus]
MIKQKKVLVLLVVALAGAGAGAALGYGPLLHYKSEGVLKVEMSTSEYKRISELADDVSTVQNFVSKSAPPGLDDAGVDRLVRYVQNAEWQKPVPRISKTDARELPDLLIQLEQEREKAKERDRASERDRTEEANQDNRLAPIVYLGVKLTAVASTPKAAADIATWMGDYFKDMATQEAVRQMVSGWVAESRQFSDRADERKRKYQFDIEQAQLKVTALKKIIADYPDAARRDTSQVVDVRRDNEKFMSPMAQLVGAESEIIGIREKIQRLDREIDQQALMKPLAVDAEAAVAQSHSGSDSVIKISKILSALSKKTQSEAQQEKLSSLAADLSATTVRFLSQPRFIAQPSVPSMPERPRPPMVIVLMAALSALASAAILWRETLIKAIWLPNAKK